MKENKTKLSKQQIENYFQYRRNISKLVDVNLNSMAVTILSTATLEGDKNNHGIAITVRALREVMRIQNIIIGANKTGEKIFSLKDGQLKELTPFGTKSIDLPEDELTNLLIELNR